MARWQHDVGKAFSTLIFFDGPTNSCWFATSDGQIRTFTLLRQVTRVLGSGWNDAIAVIPSIDGLSVFVVTSDGTVWVAARNAAERNRANAVATVDQAALSADRLPNGDLVVLDTTGTIHRVSWRSGEVQSTFSADLATTVAATSADDEVLITISEPASEVRRISLAHPTSPVETLSLDSVIAVVEPHDSTGVVASDDAGKISKINWSGAAEPFSVDIPNTTSVCRWCSLYIVAAGSMLHFVEWGEDVQTLPLNAGLDPLVPGGWADLEVDYAGAGLQPTDIEWTVNEGSMAATLSVANSESQTSRVLRVIAGVGAKEFWVTARKRADGTVVAARRFRVVALWPDTLIGPPKAITGVRQVYAKAGWGGGPAGPQNINARPAPEEFRVAVAVFRVKGAVSTVDAAVRATSLTTFVNGPDASARRFYEEVSFRSAPASNNPTSLKGTTIKLLGGQVFNPIEIDYAWADLFEPFDENDQWSAWKPKPGSWDLLGGTLSTNLLDRGLADSVTKLADAFIFAVLPGTDAPYKVGDKTWPAQWTWAFAGEAQIYWKDQYSGTFVEKPATVMPAAFPTSHPGPWDDNTFVAAVIHELGHNLQCPDLYNSGAFPAEVAVRDVGVWDMMSDSIPLPHFSLPLRMRLGWIKPEWIEVCDFGQNPASRTITLQAIETLTRDGPPAGRRAGIEIRIRDGWNYYFEHRRQTSAPFVGDRNLPAVSAVLGTDVNQARADEVNRPLIMLLPNDADGEGPILRTLNDGYEESDVTNPDRMNDFRLTRQSLVAGDANAVQVHVEYVGAHRPELQISPAPGRGNFKSPDIDIDGPAGPNVAVKGKTNVVKVRVHNRGTKAADAVQIQIQWLPFTTAAGPWTSLPSPPTQTIPAHSTREFAADWNLPALVTVGDTEAKHFCVRVDVARYVDPIDPSGSEIVVHNNWAQSNFSTDAAAHGSPSDRRVTSVTATNVLPVAAIHRTLVEQSSPHFRAFVDHAWRRLEPRQTDVTQISYESLAGDPLHDRDFQTAFRQQRDMGLVNDFVMRTFVMPDKLRDGPIERWGAQLLIRAGLRTFIDRIAARGELVSGTVYASDNDRAQPVNGGNVRLVGWPASRVRPEVWIDGQVENDGEFRFVLPANLLHLASQERVFTKVYYHGSAIYAPCESREIDLRR